MTLKEALAQLEKLGDEGMRAWNVKNGARDAQFGVKHGDIRKLAKKIKADHELALELWGTGNLDARYLAILILTPKKLSAKELEEMVRSAKYAWLADWLNNYVVKLHPDKEALREKWMKSKAKDSWVARAGWHLTAERVAKSRDGLDLAALLDRIESEAGAAAPETQWTMNNVLMQIGIDSPAHRKRAIAIGESLGLYRDYPVSKGCVPPFAPIAIPEMVRRQG